MRGFQEPRSCPCGNVLLLGASTDALPRPLENNRTISQDVSPSPARVALAFLFSLYNRAAPTSLGSLQKAACAHATLPDARLRAMAAQAPEQCYFSEEDISHKILPFAGQRNGRYQKPPPTRTEMKSPCKSCLILLPTPDTGLQQQERRGKRVTGV